MAPQTNIGSSTPIQATGQDFQDDLRRKVVNDAAAYVGELAREHGRNAAAAEAISPERLRRFFNTLDNSYQIKKELRERVVFAQHNLLSDPPFSRLDLISCRNLLIYLDGQAQGRRMCAELLANPLIESFEIQLEGE